MTSSDGNGPGVTRSSVTIGIAINEATGAQLERAGFGTEIGDPVSAVRAAAEILNARGGIASRTIRIAPYRHTDDRTPYASAVCARFTEDEQVFAVLQLNPADAATRSCFAKRGMPVIDGVGSAGSEQNRSPHHYALAGFTLERLATTLADRLEARGVLRSGEQIGIVTFDEQAHRRVVQQVLVPRLRAHRRDVAAIAYIPPGLADATSAAPGAVTRFRERGVDLVLVFEGSARVSGPFTHAAAAQGAEFRYGLTSASLPSLQARNQKYLIHDDALRRATVVGWHALADLAYQHGATRALPAVAHEWRGLLAERGITFREECCGLNAALALIDKLRFLQAGVAASGGSAVNAGRFRAGVDQLGTTYRSLLTDRTTFGPGLYDGASGIRYAQWDPSCECLKYVSRPIPLP